MTSVSAPVLQKQNRTKHSSVPHLQMAAAWLSFHPPQSSKAGCLEGGVSSTVSPSPGARGEQGVVR